MTSYLFFFTKLNLSGDLLGEFHIQLFSNINFNLNLNCEILTVEIVLFTDL